MIRSMRMAVTLSALVAAACGSPSADDTPILPPEQLALTESTTSGEPNLAAGIGSGAVASWLDYENDEYVLRYATLTDRQWSAERDVARGAGWFANWADLPSVVPIAADTWAAHWLVLQPDSFGAYDIYTAVSADAGATWTDPALLNIDGTEAEHGFLKFFPWDDAIGVLWLDGRNYLLEELPASAPELRGGSLRYARLNAAGEVVERGAVDELVCECCAPDAALTGDDGLLVSYRDRTEEEIRDIVVRRFDGERWQDPVVLGPDNWRIEGCPINGASMDTAGDDVVVAWFTGAGDVPRVRLARSADGGASFGAAIDVDTVGSFGQVDVVLTDTGAAVVSWWRRGETDGTALVARSVAADGAFGPIVTVAESEYSQPLDVPKMVRAGDGLVFVWTDLVEDGGVRSVYADLRLLAGP